MHEFSIAQNIVKESCKQLAKHKGKKISKIILEIGQASGVVVEALSFALPQVCKNTPLENCQFEFNKIALLIKCQECHKEHSLLEFNLLCPSCYSFDIKILKGKDLLIKSMEIE